MIFYFKSLGMKLVDLIEEDIWVRFIIVLIIINS